ncbi:acetyltransferase [Microvirga sp. BSC39]|uniref:acetyltransferase n=1 Tax=Microvirga sp. BSC39 TaxID=1549810 RepID=UPI001FCC3EFC|nr:acetyltransferase [Microvirga sp. BSC39]
MNDNDFIPTNLLMLTVRQSRSSDLETLFNIWLAAVRATHSFLSEADVELYANVVRSDYLPHAELWVAVDVLDAPVAFMGMTGAMIDALFVAPEQHGKGVGRLLVQHAREREGVLTVDVNEQNEGARAFYRRLGFQETGRSELDGSGRPFPVVHMKIAK